MLFLGCMAMQEYRYPLLFLLLWCLRDGKNVEELKVKESGKSKATLCYVVLRYRRAKKSAGYQYKMRLFLSKPFPLKNHLI